MRNVATGIMATAILLAHSWAADALTFDVFFNNFAFFPATVTIQAGDTVRWNNLGGTHTVTGTGADPICGSGPVVSSQSITFNTPGAFPYQCNFHVGLGMTGLVVVTAVSGPPVILQGPTNVAVAAGTTGQLSILASGTAPLSYSWQKGQVAVSSATNSILTLLSVASGDAGAYQCVVSNAFGAVTSSVAVVTVGDQPVVTQQPQPQTVTVSNTVSLSVAASGTPTLRYQWLKDGASISGAVSPALQLDRKSTRLNSSHT